MRNKRVKDKERDSHEASRRRIEKSLFGQAEGYKLTQNCPCHQSAIQEWKKKGAAKITCPYRTNHHHREFRQADSKDSMPMAVEDTDPH